MINPAEWRAFLAAWHAEMLACDDLAAALPQETRVPGWAGYPGAPEAALTVAEARIGARLPPAYRAFLRASDGWPQAGFFIARLLPASRDRLVRRGAPGPDRRLDRRHALRGPAGSNTRRGLLRLWRGTGSGNDAGGVPADRAPGRRRSGG